MATHVSVIPLHGKTSGQLQNSLKSHVDLKDYFPTSPLFTLVFNSDYGFVSKDMLQL